MKSIKLCCGKKGCPVISEKDGKITIKDDYGHEVIMESSQAALLPGAVKQLLKGD
jgi:hypothetical protein